MRKYVSKGQEWEEADDEDCWGVDYTEPTTHMKAKIASILYTWEEDQPETVQDEAAKKKEKSELIPTVLITKYWILLTHPKERGTNPNPPLKNHKGWPEPRGNAADIRGGGVKAKMNWPHTP